jgi:hypothetical protein
VVLAVAAVVLVLLVKMLQERSRVAMVAVV